MTAERREGRASYESSAGRLAPPRAAGSAALPGRRTPALARRVAALALAALLLVAAGTPAELTLSAQRAGELEVGAFTRADCAHCARARAFLGELAARHPGLRVVERDVALDPAALARLRALAERAGLRAAVPAFHVRDRLLVGFRGAATTGAELEALLVGSGSAPPVVDAVDAPWLGRLRVSEIGLPLFTVALGLLDGFNPCAMWALLFILSLLVRLRSRARMLAVGGTFVAVGGLVYFAFLAAWLNLFLFAGAARPVQVALGLLAIAAGALHWKDAVVPGRGPSLHIPAAARPRLYARVRRVLQAEDLGGALVAVTVLALFVNFVELLCTAGLPALYTRVLSLQGLPPLAHYGYLALYCAAYVLDHLLVLAVAVATLGGRRLQERHGRWLDAVSGAVLVGLGAVLALRPGWLAGLAG